jgi:hypothetical protein
VVTASSVWSSLQTGSQQSTKLYKQGVRWISRWVERRRRKGRWNGWGGGGGIAKETEATDEAALDLRFNRDSEGLEALRFKHPVPGLGCHRLKWAFEDCWTDVITF